MPYLLRLKSLWAVQPHSLSSLVWPHKATFMGPPLHILWSYRPGERGRSDILHHLLGGKWRQTQGLCGACVTKKAPQRQQHLHRGTKVSCAAVCPVISTVHQKWGHLCWVSHPGCRQQFVHRNVPEPDVRQHPPLLCWQYWWLVKIHWGSCSLLYKIHRECYSWWT